VIFGAEGSASLWHGLAKWYKGDNDGAIADCDKAIQLDPKDPSSYISRAHKHAAI
jgi:Tfp pilus assembly protein PilF